jgi:hypothetical protein
MAPPSMVLYINSSIVNNMLYTIWYDILNIANNGAANYGNIQKSRSATKKAAAVRQGRQRRRNNEGSSSTTRKAEPAAQR